MTFSYHAIMTSILLVLNPIAAMLSGPPVVEREETWGRVSPYHPTRDLGECRKLPQWGLGTAPA